MTAEGSDTTQISRMSVVHPGTKNGLQKIPVVLCLQTGTSPVTALKET